MDPCDDLTDDDIRTAIQNATGPKSALFVPEVDLSYLSSNLAVVNDIFIYILLITSIYYDSLDDPIRFPLKFLFVGKYPGY